MPVPGSYITLHRAAHPVLASSVCLFLSLSLSLSRSVPLAARLVPRKKRPRRRLIALIRNFLLRVTERYHHPSSRLRDIQYIYRRIFFKCLHSCVLCPLCVGIPITTILLPRVPQWRHAAAHGVSKSSVLIC